MKNKIIITITIFLFCFMPYKIFAAPEGVDQAPGASLALDYIAALHAKIDREKVAGNSGRIVKVIDFGAKGDGLTNDANAIQQALNSLQSGDTLSFENSKTYALGSAGWNSLQLISKSNILINGNNATLKLNYPVSQSYHSADNGPVVLYLKQCNNCEVRNITFELGSIATGAFGVDDSKNAVFRNLIARGGKGPLQFWSTRGVSNIWLSNYSDRITSPTADSWGFYIGNTNVGFEDVGDIFAGNSVYHERWDGFVMMIKDATIVGNSGIDNPWSTMISPGWIKNINRNHVVIGNYLKGGANYQFQVDMLPDGSYLDGLVLFGNWLNGTGSGPYSSGAYVGRLHNGWIFGNKVTDANHSGIQVFDNSQHIVISNNNVYDTGAPTMGRGISITTCCVASTINDVRITGNNITNAVNGIEVEGNSNVTRDNVYVGDNFVSGGNQLSGSTQGTVTIAGWRNTRAPEADGSLIALSSLSKQLPVGALRTEIENIITVVTAYRGLGSNTILKGDINKDGIVNSLDWSLMNSKWFSNDTTADLNNDGIVNSLDFSIMNGNWLKAS